MFGSGTGNDEIVSDSRKRPRHDRRMMKYTLPEASFRDNFYKEEIKILDMIRYRSCRSKFKDFCRNRLENHGKTDDALLHYRWRPNSNSGLVSRRLLFQKELTPSDVGKLNRLVIPKKYAVEHFPSVREAEDASGDRRNYVDDTELVFHDRLMKVWKFRYCYWKSSQSFVFTRGWNRFVQEKELRAKDVVAFYTCEYTNNTEEEAGTFLMIDVSYINGRCEDNKESNPLENREGLDLQLGKGGSFRGYGSEEEEEGEEEEEHKEEENGVRLFGVQIN